MFRGLSTKRDHLLVSIIGSIFGLFCLPILGNIAPSWWKLTFASGPSLIVGFSIFANLALWLAGLIGKKYPGIFQFAKYAATGAMNSFTDIGILNLLSLIFQVFSGPLIILFNTFAFSVAVTNSYFWNNLWVFRIEGKSLSLREFFKFLSVTVSGLVINTVVVYILTTFIEAPGSISPQLWENIAKLVAVPSSVVWNFIGYKLFVFKRPVA